MTFIAQGIECRTLLSDVLVGTFPIISLRPLIRGSYFSNEFTKVHLVTTLRLVTLAVISTRPLTNRIPAAIVAQVSTNCTQNTGPDLSRLHQGPPGASDKFTAMVFLNGSAALGNRLKTKHPLHFKFRGLEKGLVSILFYF